MEKKTVESEVTQVTQAQCGSQAPGEPTGKTQSILRSVPSHAPHLLSWQSPMPSTTSAGPLGPERGEGQRAQSSWELPCGIAGLAFFAGATSSALDSEKDAVLLGAGVWGGTRRESKSQVAAGEKRAFVLKAPKEIG